MIVYTTTGTDNDLQGILALQQQNLAAHLPAAEISKEGFVTVLHSPDDLRRLHEQEKSIIAKDGDRVIAYILAMTAADGRVSPC